MIDIDVEAKRIAFSNEGWTIVGQLISAHQCTCGYIIQVKALIDEEINLDKYRDRGDGCYEIANVNGAIILLDKKHHCDNYNQRIIFSDQVCAQECLEQIFSRGDYREDKPPKLDPIEPENLVMIEGVTLLKDKIGKDPDIYLVDFNKVKKGFYGETYYPKKEQQDKAVELFMGLMKFKDQTTPRVKIVDDLERTKRPPKPGTQGKEKGHESPRVEQKTIKPKKAVYVEQMSLF